MRWYAYGEQDRHYRTAARDRGCTCPDGLPAHVHELTCLLYTVPGGVPGGMHDHSQAADTVVPGGGASEPPRAEGPRESTGEGNPRHAPSPAGDYIEHLDQEHDSDEGRPWI